MINLVILNPLFLVDNSEEQFFIKCPTKRPCLASLNVHAIVNSSVGSHTPLSVAEHSSEIEIGGLCVDSRQQAAFIEQNLPSSAVNLENYFTSGSPLCPEELLIYSLTKMQFKNSTFTRHHTMVKYEKIAEVVN